jgi:hypothetical protein
MYAVRVHSISHTLVSGLVFQRFPHCLDGPSLVFVLQILFGEKSAMPPRGEMWRPVNGFSSRGRRRINAKFPIIDVNRGNFLQECRNIRTAQDTLNYHNLNAWAAGHVRSL